MRQRALALAEEELLLVARAPLWWPRWGLLWKVGFPEAVNPLSTPPGDDRGRGVFPPSTADLGL